MNSMAPQGQDPTLFPPQQAEVIPSIPPISPDQAGVVQQQPRPRPDMGSMIGALIPAVVGLGLGGPRGGVMGLGAGLSNMGTSMEEQRCYENRQQEIQAESQRRYQQMEMQRQEANARIARDNVLNRHAALEEQKLREELANNKLIYADKQAVLAKETDPKMRLLIEKDYKTYVNMQNAKTENVSAARMLRGMGFKIDDETAASLSPADMKYVTHKFIDKRFETHPLHMWSDGKNMHFTNPMTGNDVKTPVKIFSKDKMPLEVHMNNEFDRIWKSMPANVRGEGLEPTEAMNRYYKAYSKWRASDQGKALEAAWRFQTGMEDDDKTPLFKTPEQAPIDWKAEGKKSAALLNPEKPKQ